MTKKDRIFLLDEIASAQLNLAEADFQELTEKAAPYIIRGELIPEDLRFDLQDALEKLQIARDKAEKSSKEWRDAVGR